MLVAIAKLIIGLALLTAGAEGLVRGASALAFRLGLSTLVIGLTVVAFGTSAPELLVCVRASLAGQQGLAVGNAVGSNIFNTGAILGIAAMIFPISCAATVVKREVPIMILSGILLLTATLVGANMGELDRSEGVIFVAIWIGYLLYAYRVARRERPEVLESHHLEFSPDNPEDIQRRGFWLDLLFVFGGLAALSFGADVLVDGAVALAHLAGVSDLVIGLTIVGAGTGLPELATSVVAAVRKHSDIAVGNVLGSNIFNIVLILGVSSSISPLTFESSVLHRDLPVMIFLFALCLPLMFTRGKISRQEGMLLFALYACYVIWIVVEAKTGGSSMAGPTIP